MAVSRTRRRVGDSSLGYPDRRQSIDVEFINPYPFMSSVEARVHLFLERKQVPFTWRYFDGELAPHLRELMPDYAPEFTLREYNTVIIIQGGYFSTLPGVLDRTALAVALLEMDGWTVVVLYEQDIYGDLNGVMEKALPWIRFPPIKGDPRVPPIGVPDFMQERRRALSAYALHRAHYSLDRQEGASRGRVDTAGRRRRRRRRLSAGRTRNRESG